MKIGTSAYTCSIPIITNTKPLADGDAIVLLKRSKGPTDVEEESEPAPKRARVIKGKGKSKSKGKGKGKGKSK